MATKTIVLFCAGGMSTSLLVNKMKEAAAAQGKDYDIAAYGEAKYKEIIPGADCVLLGPQIRFRQAQMKRDFPDTPIEPIDMKDYGTMNGKAVLAYADKLMGVE